ncbi:hybrid sensor histidine kinase/response regulator [Leptolyngbya sp. AN02str]|uniref:hybrid sensor histidine kinase/response regulator n=1 Tax=Leptolyngbya sp. AN02str TaxID=3423363 RepID=UPI003D30F40C
MKKILVIEDDELIRANLQDLLELEGFDVICADTGAQGLAQAQSICPDLIISDIMMPGLNGYDLLTSLRQDSQLAFIPFIFLSAKAEKTNIRHGMKLGADDYLTKPFESAELLDAISTRLAKQAAIAQLQHTIQELQQLNESKEDTLSVLSHDLRSPLTNMQMVISLLKTADSVEKQQSYMKILQDECVRELDLINDILDLQRLESDCAFTASEVFSVYDCLTKIINIWETRIQDNHQALTINAIPEISLVFGDRHSLERILTELLSNACKYTPPQGSINIDIDYHQTDNNSKSCFNLIFKISNTADIVATEVPNLFKKFYRASNARSSKQLGTGLGLTILEKLVEKLKGTLTVDSQAGWISFTIHLPLSRVNPLPLRVSA